MFLFFNTRDDPKKKVGASFNSINYHLGMLFNLQGRLDQARTELKDALGIFESFPQLSRENHRIISGCYYHLGVNNLYRGTIKDARKQFQSSLKMDQQMSDGYGIKLCEEALDYCDSLEK